MQIHNELLKLRAKEKQITSQILSKLQEVEDHRVYLQMGYSSLFDYLVRGLGYSETTAYQRQACLRLTKEVPEIKEKLDHGTLSVSAVTAVYKHIRKQSTSKKREVLMKIENKSSREVKRMFAPLAKPVRIKKTEYKDKVHIRLELSHEQNQKLEKLKALRSHQGGLEELVEKMIDRELTAYENARPRASRGSSNPRYISKRLRNAVLQKANYKCQKPNCQERHFLQIDHIIPVRLGGKAEIENLQVLCGAHNRFKG